jgi:glycerol-3-phosphate acyltransferase PlsY
VLAALIPGLLILGAYLLGAVPFGLILAKTFAGLDVRTAGSGNIGATNVARSAGKKLGAVTLLLDAAKGALPVLIAEYALEQPLEIAAACGLAAVVGHIFPLYLRFRGGKGVATGFGVFLAIAPIPTLVAVGVFAVLFAIFRVVSIGSLGGAIALIGAVVGLDGRRELIALAGAVVALVVARHAGNIGRILKRSERPLS